MNGEALGYKLENGMIILDKDGADTVKIIFKYYLQGMSIRWIVIKLYEERRKNNRGKIKWDHPRVGTILKNSDYIGDVYHPQIISPADFQTVQERRWIVAKNQGKVKSQYKKGWEELLEGRFFCKECGKEYRYYMNDRRKTASVPKWKCSTQQLYKKCSNTADFSETEMEQAIVEVINRIIQNKCIIERRYEKVDIKNNECLKMEKELERLIKGTEEVSPEDIIALAKQRAAEQYKTLVCEDYEYQTEKIRKIIGTQYTQEVRIIFQNIVERLFCGKENEIQFQLINGTIVTWTDNSKEHKKRRREYGKAF